MALLLDAATIGVWVGVGVAVVALAVAITVAYKQRKRKILSYRAFAEFPLVNPGPMASKIAIVSGDRTLVAPHLLLLAVSASGNEPIRSEDFATPLSVSFVDSEIIQTDLELSDKSLSITYSVVESTQIHFSAFLLNPGEGFVLTMLLEGAPHDLTVAAHIAGGQVREQVENSFAKTLVRGLAEGVSLSIPLVGSIALSTRARPAS